MARTVLPALLLSAPLAAQERPKPAPPVFPAGLEVVNLTVTVRDRAGDLVTDLGPEDFVVLENGRPQAIQVFGRVHEPGQDETMALDLGLLMDTSASMLKELKLSQQAAVRFLEAIPRARDLLTIFFDHDIQISRYDSEQQQGLIERIHSLKGGGNTALYDAITVYLSRVQEGTGRKVLVLFTDGEDSISEVSLSEVIQMVRGSSVTIYPIAFTGGSPRGSPRGLVAKAFLMQLAEISGGAVFTPTGSRDLPGIYDKILEELSAQYVLGFVSDDPRRDGKFRKLKVEVRRRGCKIRHRAGYHAPSERERR